MKQQTLVIIKPDGVQRNLIGEIIRYYEDGGLKVVALKLLEVSKDLVAKHYTEDEDYMLSIGEKAASKGVKIANLLEYGRGIIQGLQKYITEGPVVAMVLEGNEAVPLVRQIRGDLGAGDTFEAANREDRPVRNLIHASGTADEAEKEVKLWFPEL